VIFILIKFTMADNSKMILECAKKSIQKNSVNFKSLCRRTWSSFRVIYQKKEGEVISIRVNEVVCC
jgi:hypothetical protein